MSRLGVVVGLLACLGSAPFQCTSEPDPNKVREEEPGEALYRLAQQFRADGDRDAWRKTLKHLMKHYPASRFAKSAEADLAADGAGGSDD